MELSFFKQSTGTLNVRCLQGGGRGAPNMSEITKAIYEKHSLNHGVNHIFVRQIDNFDTTRCLAQMFGARTEYPDIDVARTLDAGTSEFEALLGSRIGEVIAYFTLCTYGHGVKEIERIFIFDKRGWGVPGISV